LKYGLGDGGGVVERRFEARIVGCDTLCVIHLFQRKPTIVTQRWVEL
jgi:hypothetical protein